jgi:hypothetical protein
LNAKRARHAALLAALVAGAGWAAACNAITGLDKYTTSSGGADAAGCGPTRYVSTQGNDSRDGCTPATARKTIKATVSDIVTRGETALTIEVCAGTYPESDLALSFPMTLRGGYDCTNWQQTATHDYPTLDRTNETIITNATPDSQHPSTLTLALLAANPSGLIVVDGFTIQGADGLATSNAVAIQAGATATVSNSRILGGDATTATSAALVQSNAAEITSDFVRGGAAPTSIAVNATISGTPTPGPKVHADTIQLGTSQSGVATGVLMVGTGVQATTAAGAPVEKTTIGGGTGVSVGVGIYQGAAVDVHANYIEMGVMPAMPDGGAGFAGLAGVNVTQGGPVRITGNRIYSGGSPAGYGEFNGVNINATSNALIANNMIYGGFDGPMLPKPGLATPIHLVDATATVVAYNTLYAGLPGGVASSSGVRASKGTTGTVLVDNILAGIGGPDFGLIIDDCTGGEFSAIEHNLFVGQGQGQLEAFGCGDAGYVAARSFAQMAPAVGSAMVDDNTTMRAACGPTNPPECIPAAGCPIPVSDAGSLSCMQGLFLGWSPSDNGLSTLLDGGWILSPGDPCTVTRGGVRLDDAGVSIATDTFGAPRGSMPSLGAAQVVDGGCE